MKSATLLIFTTAVMLPGSLLAQTATEPYVVALPVGPPVPALPAAPVFALPANVMLPPTPSAQPAPAAARAPQAPAAPKAVPAPAAAPATAPMPPAPPRVPYEKILNVRIEVTLSDSAGPTKTLSMMVADGESGMNRTTAPGSPSSFQFNADAVPTIAGTKVRLRLTADATVGSEPDKARVSLRQSQIVMLNDAQAVEIARAADPTSDRTFILSVKATIQR